MIDFGENTWSGRDYRGQNPPPNESLKYSLIDFQDNHRNRITSLDTCEELRFFITGSHDESIKGN